MRVWFQRVFVEIEEHIRHVHNQTSRRFGGLQNLVQLLFQPFAHLLRLLRRLLRCLLGGLLFFASLLRASFRFGCCCLASLSSLGRLLVRRCLRLLGG